MKKILLLTMTMILCIIYTLILPVDSVFANEDVTPPVLESIEVSPLTVKVGETITVKAKVTDDMSGVAHVGMVYNSPSSQNKMMIFNLSQNNEGFWEGKYTVQSYDENGKWTFDYMVISDKAFNHLPVNKENNVLDEDLTIITIENDTGGDVTPPVLDNIEVSPLNLKVGEYVTVKAKVSDDMSGVEHVSMNYSSPSSNSRRSVRLYKENEGLFEGIYFAQSNDESGKWILDSIFIEDKAGNDLYLHKNNNNLPDEDLTSFTIENESGGDKTPPVIENIEVSPLNVKVGETVTVKAKVTDDMSGVNEVLFYYKSPSENSFASLTLNHDIAGDYWMGSYKVREGAEFGLWKLQQITLNDKAGNELVLFDGYNNLPQGYITDFTVGNIPPEDLTPPESPSVNDVIEISKTITGTAEVGSIITVKVGNKVIGTAITTSEGKYTVEIEKQKAGTILYLTATDAAGNQSKATEVIIKKYIAPDDNPNSNPNPNPNPPPIENIVVIDNGKENLQKCYHESLVFNAIGCLKLKNIVPVYKQLNNRLIKVDYLKVDNYNLVYEEIPQMLGLGGNTWIERTSAINYETPSKKMLIKNAQFGSKSSGIMWKGLELKSGQIGKVTILEDIVVWETINKNKKSSRVLKKGQQFRVYRYVPSTYYIGDGRYVVKDEQVIFQQVD
ncbi:DUF7743 domain-containing protein [Psychrobacillus lasiicapitis]|uniref:Uncharacterized protein n=1 Tax=Psychrobacillus lasiicapitis TaxID=1636719 RepID=A0A544T8S1_9BACI|nr:Ig-like domain-containing protein [Psychrobacillus lasiicapitis]TQR13859.1 hypothetical protein FG382_09625 [Psychrobacillus lasiicapitis]GGA36049.1 hypothetical protein GCM10011384_27190 [Psychrobacillus lasiicapitis]